MRWLLFVVALSAWSVAATCYSQELVLGTLPRDDFSTAMAFAPDGSLWIAEKAGKVYRVADLESGERQIVLEVAGHDTIERGLLGIAFLDHWLYLHYIRDDGDARIVRFDVTDPAVPGEEQLIFDLGTTGFYHVGGAIAFGPDGKLYIGSGEGKRRARELPSRVAQSAGAFKGKILRINRDGTVPRDNRFSSPVYTYGHRNPQGFDWHPATGDMWESEHGNSGNDEVNAIRAGLNFGWPRIEGAATMTGMEAPVTFYSPSIAPSGASFYRGQRFPQFANNFFVATLRGTHLLP